MKTFVDLDQIDSRYFEKPDYLLSDGAEYARAVHELVQAKIEQRAPQVEIETPKGETPKVVNIMDALKKSMQARGQVKVRDAVGKKAKSPPKRGATPRSVKPR